MRILKLKGCKRCGGDLFLERDYEGTFIACLQCSAVYVLGKDGNPKQPEPKKLYAR